MLFVRQAPNKQSTCSVVEGGDNIEMSLSNETFRQNALSTAMDEFDAKQILFDQLMITIPSLDFVSFLF